MPRMTPEGLRNHPNAKKLMGLESWTGGGAPQPGLVPAAPVPIPPPPSTTIIPADAPGAPKAHKYKVSPKAERTCDGIVFDSKVEMKCYEVLRDSGLQFERQPEYELQPAFWFKEKKFRPIIYRGDFLVRHRGQEYLLDVKGMLMPEFKMKLKMLLFTKGREIILIKNPKGLRTWIANLPQG